jgi:hypothetical protein
MISHLVVSSVVYVEDMNVHPAVSSVWCHLVHCPGLDDIVGRVSSLAVNSEVALKYSDKSPVHVLRDVK